MFRAFAVAFVSVLAIFAYGAEVIEGSLSCMKGEKYITIKLDIKLTYLQYLIILRIVEPMNS